MTDDAKRGLTAQDFHAARAEIMNQGVRGLLLINGGAAVALLAFLQAIWKVEPDLAKYVVVGIGIFSLGVLLAGCINFFRYHTSLNFQAGNLKLYDLFRRLSYLLQYLSLACFGAGMFNVVIGALHLLQ